MTLQNNAALLLLNRPTDTSGAVYKLTLPDSPHLASNQIDDTRSRDLIVYTPPGYDVCAFEGADTPLTDLPLIVYLAAYLSSGMAATNWRPFGDNLVERLDRLMGSGQMAPAVVVMPDGYTPLGGNQYLESSIVGDYGPYIRDDVVGFMERATGAGGEGRRGCVGFSSGGYGSLIQGFYGSDFWSAIACHSGDMGFEWVYGASLPESLTHLTNKGIEKENLGIYINRLKKDPKPSGKDISAFMLLAMGAMYAPNSHTFWGLDLPVCWKTCQLDAEAWTQWKAHDPITIAQTHAGALAGLKGVYIDCGDRDQYHIHYGGRILSDMLRGESVDHIYEEFPDNHSSVAYRLDISLPWMSNLLKG
jgi:hypothetical protein